ncbi:LPS assembly lipoprotein LptE [Diaphorobacter sp.]|uniref:LPS-assembly lipoprotein LptE n=1 Tax=Diaphorobacter sp. TaxID=1934310 RepID=UPI0028B0973C|nr:LPS assembly lipoprotein LptE [Diaphorobacter sp.]
MQKRTVLTMFAAVPLLAACGFRLRGAPDFSFKSIYVKAPHGSQLARELVRTLKGAGGDVVVITDVARMNEAEAICNILSEQRERVVVGLNASGQVRELQLRLRLHFSVSGPQGQEYVPSTEMLQQRDVSYNESIALSKEGEEAMLYKNMQTDLVQQLMRRLARVKLIPVS